MYWIRYFALKIRLVRLIYEKTLFSYIKWRRQKSKTVIAVKQKCKPYKIGIIGVGKHCKEVIIPALSFIDNIEIKRLCTRTTKSAEAVKQKYNIETTTDYRDIINDIEIDGVIISTKSSMHTPYSVSALKAGKTVFCEAPGVTLPSDIKGLDRLKDKLSRLIFGYHFCYCPIYFKLKEQMKNINTKKEFLFRFPAEYYMYSLAIFLNGRIKDIKCTYMKGEFERRFEGNFENGDFFEIHVHDGKENNPDNKIYNEFVMVYYDNKQFEAVNGKKLVLYDKIEKKKELIFECDFSDKIQDKDTLIHRGYIPELEKFVELIEEKNNNAVGLDLVADSYSLNWALFESLRTPKSVKPKYYI